MSMVKLEDTVYYRFPVHSTSGALVAADSTPTVDVEEDGVSIGAAGVTVTSISTGFYRITIVCSAANGYEAGKRYSVAVTAVVATVTDKKMVAEFLCTARYPDDLCFPNVSGRGIDVDASGGVEVGSFQASVITATAINAAAFTAAKFGSAFIVASSFAAGAIDSGALDTTAVNEIRDAHFAYAYEGSLTMLHYYRLSAAIGWSPGIFPPGDGDYSARDAADTKNRLEGNMSGSTRTVSLVDGT